MLPTLSCAGAGERSHRELFEPEDPAAPDQQPPLPALLAWEARIESVRERPFDTPTLVRCALFLHARAPLCGAAARRGLS